MAHVVLLQRILAYWALFISLCMLMSVCLWLLLCFLPDCGWTAWQDTPAAKSSPKIHFQVELLLTFFKKSRMLLCSINAQFINWFLAISLQWTILLSVRCDDLCISYKDFWSLPILSFSIFERKPRSVLYIILLMSLKHIYLIIYSRTC